MLLRHRRLVGVATRGIAVVGIAAMVAVPLAPVTQSAPMTQSPPLPTVSQDVQLAAATVPPGGLITSFLGNQVTYCSIICPLLVETAVTALATTLQTPGTFAAALQSGDLWKAIGITAASVTGPTNAAAQAAIFADGALVAPRALNAFQVAVVGLLNVIPAVAGGLPGIAAAIETARRDTFTALNLPIVPNPTQTVMPRGVAQVAVVGAINVVGAVIFPAFNHVLSAAFGVPDAIAQELALTGDPIRAVAAGINTAVRELAAAGAVIADSVVTAVRDIGRAIDQSQPTTLTVQSQNSTTAAPDPATVKPVERSRSSITATKPANDEGGSTDPQHDVASTPRRTAREVVEDAVAKVGLKKDAVTKDAVTKVGVAKDAVTKDAEQPGDQPAGTGVSRKAERADRSSRTETSHQGADR